MLYLDNSATTKVSAAAARALCACMEEGYFNPSALYAPALAAEKKMTACREGVLRVVGAKNARVVFTSGGTEANNLAILGQLKALHGGGRVLFSAGEHPAVREACLGAAGFEALEIPYNPEGLVDLEALQALLTPNVRMICCMQVNNETGVIQPLADIAALRDAKAPWALMHVDGVQGFLRVPVQMDALHIDSYALSGHKIHAVKGIGALVLSKRCRVLPLQLGGGQEQNIRSGTENTPGIAALHAAVQTYPAHDMGVLKAQLYQGILNAVPGAQLNGLSPDDLRSAPHILNISLPPVRSETMLHALEAEGIYVGIGSACASHKSKGSVTLRAMGCAAKRVESALRFSLCPDNTAEEIDQVIAAVARHYAVLARYQRR